MQEWHLAWATEALRVLKPGGYLLAFGGSRTYHRLASAVEDAGFEIRDQIMWLYGSGFPKSLNVSKAMDKAAGAERQVLAVVDTRGDYDGKTRTSQAINTNWRSAEGRSDVRDLSKKEISSPTTDEAKQWDGWGTALKPAHEPIVVARKPLIGTVADNVLKHGTGALNIDECRVNSGASPSTARRASGAPASCRPGEYGHTIVNRITPERYEEPHPGELLGRWPANIIHDGSDEVLAAFPDAPGNFMHSLEDGGDGRTVSVYGSRKRLGPHHAPRKEDTKSAARFFYVAKASRKDRDEGLEATTTDRKTPMAGRGQGGLKCMACGKWKASGSPCVCPEPQFEKQDFESPEVRNPHPTVKPTELMRYLCRLVTRAGGVVLDPFMGSGSTGKAAIKEGFRFIGIERDEGYFAIANQRVAHALETEGN